MMYELTNKKERKKKKKGFWNLEVGFKEDSWDGVWSNFEGGSSCSCEVAEIWEWKEGEKENREKRESERRNDKVWSEWLFLLCEVYVRKWHLREANRKENRERMRKQKRKN